MKHKGLSLQEAEVQAAEADSQHLSDLLDDWQVHQHPAPVPAGRHLRQFPVRDHPDLLPHHAVPAGIWQTQTYAVLPCGAWPACR